MKDTAYYRWLDSPMTDEEIGELVRLESKYNRGQVLAKQVEAAVEQLQVFFSSWPRRCWGIYSLEKLTPKLVRRASGPTWRLDPSRFDLTAGESEYWPELLEKQRRPAYLSQFRYDPDTENGFLARLKRDMPVGGDIRKYLNDELSLFSQQHADFVASTEPDEQGQDRRPPDRTVHYLIAASRNRRAEEFKQYIANELAKLEQHNDIQSISSSAGLPIQASTSVLQFHRSAAASHRSRSAEDISLRAIAMLHFFMFEDKPAITDDSRGVEIAKAWNWNSGKALYNKYIVIRKDNGITGADGQKLPSMLKDIEAILPLLEGLPNQRALKAYNELQLKVD